MNCNICGRKLDNPNDPLSENCGGDCAYCMLRIETEAGDYQVARTIANEIAMRLMVIKNEE